MKNNVLSISDKICLAITSVAGVGYIPFASGTWACVVAVGLFALIESSFLFVMVTCLSVALAYACSTHAERLYNKKDCKKIVIDDFAGMLVTLLFLPRDPKLIIVAFFLFRALDLVKIPPAHALERYPGAKGIVGDDVVAGLYGCIIMQAVRFLLMLS
jgi:phosphatidylglycerophosphatase A